MIAKDETVDLLQHHRRITFVPGTGKIIVGKKSRQSQSFLVTHLAMKWYEGAEPGPVVAHGVYNHPTHGIVHAERSYDLDSKKCPQWIKEAVRG